MGPRLFSRGNGGGYAGFEGGPYVLQWGHDFSAVEILCLSQGWAGSSTLQWGHDFSAVEIRLKDRIDLLKLLMLQ